MKRALFLTFLVFGLSCLAMATGQNEKPSGPVEISYWTMDHGAAWMKYIVAATKDFERDNPGIRVVDENTQHRDYETKLPTAIAAGSAPDIWTQSYRQLDQFEQNMAPIDKEALAAMGYSSMESFKKDWLPGALEDYSIDGKVYGLRYQSNVFGYCVNRKHFLDAGLDPETDFPRTWDDTISLGKKLVIKEGGRIKRQAMNFPYNYPAVWYFMEFQPIMKELGGTVMNEKGTECLMNSEAAVGAIQTIKRRFDEGITDKDISTTLDYMKAFGQGEFSMGICSLMDWTKMWETQNPELMKGNIKMIMSPTFPGKTPAIVVSSWGRAVNKSSKHKKEAWKLMRYYADDVSRLLQETGMLIPKVGWEKTEGAKTVPDIPLVTEALKYQMTSGLTRNWTAVSEPIKQALQSIFYEGKDIQETLNRVKTEVDKAVKY